MPVTPEDWASKELGERDSGNSGMVDLRLGFLALPMQS